MIKYIIIFISFISLVSATITDIDNKIDTNKQQYKSISKNKKNIDNNLDRLAKKINGEESAYKNIINVLDKTSTKLLLNKMKLDRSKKELIRLKKESTVLKKQKDNIEKNVVDYVIEKYSMSMGIRQANKETLPDIINKEIYLLIFSNAKQEVLDLNINYIRVNRSTRINKDKIKKTNKFITQQKEIRKKYLNMKKEQASIVSSLRVKHQSYQKYLQLAIDKQNNLTDLLGSLNILKKKEITKERKRQKRIKAEQRRKELQRKKALAKKKELERKKRQKILSQNTKIKKEKLIKFASKRKLDKEIDIEVRKIGSSAKGIKISKYRGRKTISPIKSYKITKKFGKYYDKVYKMEIFNESVSLKPTKKNSKVLSIFKGEVVYSKKNSGLLDNVVIVKHSGGLHTIYSHLDKISPTIKVGKWIPKGYVVGRVSGTLLFQATKNSKYINPEKLFK